MFDIGFWELATIAIIGIVVVGPKRLPEVVRTILIIIRKIRRAFNNIKDDIERELDLDNLRQQMNELDMQEHIRKINQSVMEMDKNIRDDFDHIKDEFNKDEVHNGYQPNEYDDTGEDTIHSTDDYTPTIHQPSKISQPRQHPEPPMHHD